MLWQALREWKQTQDIGRELMRAQIVALKEMKAHQIKEEQHWHASATHRQREEYHHQSMREELRDLRREPTGPISVG
jgi:hypothetical protein